MWLLISFVLASLTVFAASDDAAIIAALTSARKLTPTTEGFQLVAPNGARMRAVKTADGGYCIFSTNGSARVFPTPMGYGFQGPSNDTRSITRTSRGFTINSVSGSVSLVKAGSAWLDRESTNNFRIIVNNEGYSAVDGALAPMPADTAYELFTQHQQQNTDQQFTQPAVLPRQQPEPIRVRTSFDSNR